jgi:hypothetical protein
MRTDGQREKYLIGASREVSDSNINRFMGEDSQM